MNDFQQLNLLSFSEYKEIRYVAENGQDSLPLFDCGLALGNGE